jgi:hypothetical protein
MRRSLTQFVLLTLRPFNFISGQGQAIGIPIASVAGFAALVYGFGVWKGATTVLALIALLFLIAGVRLEMAKREAERVNLRFEALPAQIWGRSPGWVQHIRVTNLGPASRFRAIVASDVSGIQSMSYGKGTVLAWEQPGETEVALGRGDSGTIRLAEFSVTGWERDAPIGTGIFAFRFFVPPQARHAAGSYIAAAEQRSAVGGTLLFDLRVRDVERDAAKDRRVRVACAEDGRPSVVLQPVKDERALDA